MYLSVPVNEGIERSRCRKLTLSVKLHSSKKLYRKISPSESADANWELITATIFADTDAVKETIGGKGREGKVEGREKEGGYTCFVLVQSDQEVLVQPGVSIRLYSCCRRLALLVDKGPFRAYVEVRRG